MGIVYSITLLFGLIIGFVSVYISIVQVKLISKSKFKQHWLFYTLVTILAFTVLSFLFSHIFKFGNGAPSGDDYYKMFILSFLYGLIPGLSILISIVAGAKK